MSIIYRLDDVVIHGDIITEIKIIDYDDDNIHESMIMIIKDEAKKADRCAGWMVKG